MVTSLLKYILGVKDLFVKVSRKQNIVKYWHLCVLFPRN